jgi:hypothetical protein
MRSPSPAAAPFTQFPASLLGSKIVRGKNATFGARGTAPAKEQFMTCAALSHHTSSHPSDHSANAARSPGRRRLLHIDTVRGLLLVLMAVNHIASDLHRVTDHPFGFMSAAEGFVFMAGLMAGYVYTRTWLREGFAAVRQGCRRRAVTLYRWHVVSYLLVFAGLMAVGFSAGALPLNTPEAFLHHPGLSLFTGPLLVQQPSLFDILPMYCVLLLATPWCLRLCERGRYATLVFASLALWAAANVLCSQSPFDNGIVNTGAFNLAAWQAIYVVGLAFGHRWAHRESQQRSSSSHPPMRATQTHVLDLPSKPVLIGLIAAAAALFSVRHGFIPSGLPENVLGALTNKNNFAPLRLLDTALIVYLAYLTVSRHPRVFSWQPFAWIGSASLTVFGTHVVVAYGLHAFPEIFAETPAGRWLGTAVMLLSLALAAFVHGKLKPSPPKPARPALHPAPLLARQPRLRRPIVRHEPRPPVPADSFHRRSR